MMTTSNEHNNAPAVPQGWTDADSDAARLALELECLLMDTKDLSVVSKWWGSANDALELHRQRLAATPAPAPAQEPAKETFQSRHEREFMERMAGNHGKLTEFCAALESFTHDYQRLYSTYKSYRDMISDLIKERDSLRDQVAKPAQEAGLTDEMIAAGGRALCDISADACNVDRDDNWALHSEFYKSDAHACIIAALRAKGGK